MSFFEPPVPPDRPEPPFEIPEPKPWWSAPANELGAPVPLRLVLARTEQVAVAVAGLTAYSTGVLLTLAIRWRGTLRDEDFYAELELFGRRAMQRRLGAELPPELLRFGVQFADGRKATTVGPDAPSRHGLAADREEEPPGPILTPSGGGGGGGEWDEEYWLWPLPPPGAMTFAIEWPSKGIELSMHEVDASPIIDASGSSEVLWPDPGEVAGSYRVSQSLLRPVREEEKTEDEEPR